MTKLEVQDVSVQFGGLLALSALSFQLRSGSILGLIGPNGAGKTTIFNVLTGVYQTSGGDVFFEDNSLLGKRPYQILTMGIARTFQNIRLFTNMTALENAMVALHSRSKAGVVGAMLRTRSQKREEKRIREEGLRGADVHGGGALRRHGGRQSALWSAAPAGNCPRPGLQTRRFASGRTGRRHEPGREPWN